MVEMYTKMLWNDAYTMASLHETPEGLRMWVASTTASPAVFEMSAEQEEALWQALHDRRKHRHPEIYGEHPQVSPVFDICEEDLDGRGKATIDLAEEIEDLVRYVKYREWYYYLDHVDGFWRGYAKRDAHATAALVATQKEEAAAGFATQRWIDQQHAYVHKKQEGQ